MNKIVLHHHTGIGDHFMCNGLVHVFAHNFDEVHLICKKPYLKTIGHLYEDYSNKIKILPVDDEFSDPVKYAEENNIPLYRVGFDKCDFSAFEQSFYKQYDLDPDLEFTNFKLPKRLDGSKIFFNGVLENLGKDYIFVHNSSSYKTFDLKIESNLPKHVADKKDTEDILDYVDTICNAAEVHVISSALHNLVFQLYIRDMIKSKNVYYHDIRKREDGGFPIRVPEGIKVVNYE
jgi:hypothetical protein